MDPGDVCGVDGAGVKGVVGVGNRKISVGILLLTTARDAASCFFFFVRRARRRSRNAEKIRQKYDEKNSKTHARPLSLLPLLLNTHIFHPNTHPQPTTTQ